MGCCQTNIETGELRIQKSQSIELCEKDYFSSEDEFAEISLNSRSEETLLIGRYTESP